MVCVGAGLFHCGGVSGRTDPVGRDMNTHCWLYHPESDCLYWGPGTDLDTIGELVMMHNREAFDYLIKQFPEKSRDQILDYMDALKSHD